MRRPFIPVFVFATFWTLSGCGGYLDTGRLRIMPMGDSITAGSTRIGASLNGYRPALYSLLVKSNVRFTSVGTVTKNNVRMTPPAHEAHSGWTFKKFCGEEDGIENAYNAIVATKPNVILLLLGSNDYRAEPKEALRRSTELLSDIFRADPTVRVFWMQVLPRREEQFNSTYMPIWHEAQRLATQEFVAKGFRVITVPRPTTYTSSLLIDANHPNQTGSEMIAMSFADALRKEFTVN